MSNGIRTNVTTNKLVIPQNFRTQQAPAAQKILTKQSHLKIVVRSLLE
jgi:hypothetical protein